MKINASSPSVWLNVSTSLTWNRPAVGIIRVEQEIAKGLSEQFGNSLRYCKWDGDKFVEVSPSEFLSRLHGEGSALDYSARFHETPQSEPRHEALPISIPNRQALAMIARGSWHLLPRRLQGFLYPFARNAINHLKQPNQRIPNKRDRRLPAVLPTKSLQNKSDALFSRGDVFVSAGLDWDTGFSEQLWSMKNDLGMAVMTFCFDLIPVKFPHFMAWDTRKFFAEYFIDLGWGSNLILCISKNTERDLKELLELIGCPFPDTAVIRLGDDGLVSDMQSDANTLSSEVERILETDFILFVSTIERRKNHDVLYRAYRLLMERGHEKEIPQMVFVGMPGWGVSDSLADITLDPLVSPKISILDHVDDTELAKLYEHALFCVYPSLYEGWGLPVGEALHFGKAVIASDRASIPEVGGDVVAYANPWNPEEWASLILKMSTDDDYRKFWEARVLQEYTRNPWSKVGAETSRHIRELLANGSGERSAS